MPGQALSEPRRFLFGKLPGFGDFVVRNLGWAAREAWDAWASAGLDAARAALGETRFAAAHETAPAWRFAFGPGKFGEGWRVGVVAPSVDRVGRRFVAVLGVDGLPAPGLESAQALAASLEDDLVAAFGSAERAEGLAAAAPGLPGSASAPPLTAGRFWTPAPGSPPIEIFADEPPPDLLVRALTLGQAEGP